MLCLLVPFESRLHSPSQICLLRPLVSDEYRLLRLLLLISPNLSNSARRVSTTQSAFISPVRLPSYQVSPVPPVPADFRLLCLLLFVESRLLLLIMSVYLLVAAKSSLLRKEG